MDNNKSTQYKQETQVQEEPDAKIIDKIVVAKRIQGEWPLNRLFALLDALTKFDVQIEEKVARLKKRTILLIVGAIAVFALVGMVGMIITENPLMLALAGIISGILIVAGIVEGILLLKYRKLDVTNDFRDYIKPLLEDLQDDIKPDSNVFLDHYLSPIDHKTFSGGKGEKYKTGGYKCRDHFFERDLVTMKFRLSDGNRAMFSVHEVLTKTHKSKWKKSASGKMKHKSKTKRRKRVTGVIKLAVNPEKFVCKELPKNGDRRISAKQSNGSLILGLKYTEKLKNENRLNPDPTMVVQGSVTLYTFLQAKKTA